MAHIPSLQKRSTGYYFRQRAPHQLRSVFGFKREIVVSLKTFDPKEARVRLKHVELHLLALYHKARSNQPADIPSILSNLQNFIAVTDTHQLPAPPNNHEPSNTLFIDGLVARDVTMPASTTAPAGLKVSEAFKRWELTKRPSASSVREYTRAINEFIECCGDNLDVAVLTKEHKGA